MDFSLQKIDLAFDRQTLVLHEKDVGKPSAGWVCFGFDAGSLLRDEQIIFL